MEYMDLLKKARNSLPERKAGDERFELPKVITIQAGKQTIIRNFMEITKKLRRDPKHVSKFLFKTLAVPGTPKDNELWLQGKLTESILNQRIEEYTKTFVLCHSCGKPDTSIQKTDKYLMMKCEACGARTSLGRE